MPAVLVNILSPRSRSPFIKFKVSRFGAGDTRDWKNVGRHVCARPPLKRELRPPKNGSSGEQLFH